MKVIDPPVNCKLLAAFPRSKYRWQAAEDTHLCHDVELTQTLPARPIVRERRQFARMGLTDRADVGNPSFQRFGGWRSEGGLDAATAIVATHDDVRDLEDVDGVL